MHGTGGTELNLPIKEIRAKSLLTSSRISDVDYCVNPYVGVSMHAGIAMPHLSASLPTIQRPGGHSS